MKLYKRITALALCAALVFGGCTSKPEKETSQDGSAKAEENEEKSRQQAYLDMLRPLAYGNAEGLKLEKGTYISIIGKGEKSEFWKTVKEGAAAAADDLNTILGYKGNDKIKVVYGGPANDGDAEEQINILDEELDRYPAALGIAVIDEQSCAVQFDLAAENDIPIVAFDSGTDYQGIEAMCSTNNEEAAKTAAGKLSDALGGQGEVVIFAESSTSASTRQRVDGFRNELKANSPEINVVNVYYMDQSANLAKSIAEEKAKKQAGEGGAVMTEEEIQAKADAMTWEEIVKCMMETHPDAKGYFGTNADVCQAILKGADELDKKDIKIVGFDGGEEQIKSLDDDRVVGLILQNPFAMGYATVIAAARAALGMGNEAFVDSGYTWVTKDNVDKKTIQNMLY